MSVQASWLTNIETYVAFEKQARQAPDRIYLAGVRRSFPDALTFAAVLEERWCFWVEGPTGWRARIVRKDAAWMSAEYRERDSMPWDKRHRRNAHAQKLVIYQER